MDINSNLIKHELFLFVLSNVSVKLLYYQNIVIL